MADLVIIGAGGIGRLALDILLHDHRPVAFVDSDPRKHGEYIDGIAVQGGFDQLPLLRASGVTHAFVAVGANRERIRVAAFAAQAGFELASAIHPLASISTTAKIGRHVLIGARAIVGVHAQVADYAMIGAGAIVEHDNVIGEGAFLHPAVRLAGTVTINRCATLGIGASVIPGRKVGEHAYVSAGAVVIHDVPEGVTVSGIPAVAA
jgi:sugar O-acyltransferase (sialic acid O-acetyltransferase NeuD family)